jgi:hypothetical protein
MSTWDDEFNAAQAAVEQAEADEAIADEKFETLTARWYESKRETDTPTVEDHLEWEAARRRTEAALTERRKVIDRKPAE